MLKDILSRAGRRARFIAPATFNRGGLSRAIMHSIDFDKLDKRFWLLDTYEGLLDRLISWLTEVFLTQDSGEERQSQVYG